MSEPRRTARARAARAMQARTRRLEPAARERRRPRARQGHRPSVRVTRRPLVPARTAARRGRRLAPQAPRGDAIRPRSGPRTRAPAPDARPRRPARPSVAGSRICEVRPDPRRRVSRARPCTRGRDPRAAPRGPRARRARRRPRPGCVRARPRTRDDVRSACLRRRRRGGAGDAAPFRRAASAYRRFRPRAPRTANRRFRWFRRGGRCNEKRARAPRGRPPHGSARPAMDRGRSRPRTGRAGARPCRHVPDRRRGTDPPEHGSRADFPPQLTAGAGIDRKRRSQRRSGERLGLAPASRNRRAGHPAGTGVTEIGLFCATARVVERHAKNCAFSLLHFRAARVANENRLSCHESSSVSEIISTISALSSTM